MTEHSVTLERAAFPELVGVSSAALAAFIADLEKNDIEMHSIMILRHGKVAFERWRKPYAPDIPHTMYSISKSVTATAVGFAVEEGLLSIETKVLEIFPEYRPKKADDFLERMTVYHLLTMTAGKDIGLFSNKAGTDWVKQFFDAKWAFAPGEGWRYISENTFMLSAILYRVTGMSMVDYLMPRLFEPLGVTRRPFWELNQDGIEAGGWGLYLTTEECAKFIFCYKNGGAFNGRQIIPEHWARQAVKNLEDNRRERDVEADTVAGYGYCFWRNGLPNSYRADGMFSQFAMVFDDYDAVLVVTSNEMDEDKTRHCIWRHFPGVFVPATQTPPEPDTQSEKLEFTALPDLPAMPRSPLEKHTEGRTVRFRRQKLLKLLGFTVSMLPLPVLYMGTDKAGDIDLVEFSFADDECRLSWNEGATRNTIVCGMDGKTRQSTVRLAGFTLTADSTAAWENENTLTVWTRPLESICQRRLRFVFKGNKVCFKPSSMPDSRCMLEYVSRRIKIYVKNPLLVKLGEKAVLGSLNIVEPTHKGAFVSARAKRETSA